MTMYRHRLVHTLSFDQEEFQRALTRVSARR